MFNKFGFWVLFGFCILTFGSAALVVGCGQQAAVTTPHGTITYLGTQSPGDVWSWTIGETTFIATNETATAWYSVPIPPCPAVS